MCLSPLLGSYYLPLYDFVKPTLIIIMKTYSTVLDKNLLVHIKATTYNIMLIFGGNELATKTPHLSSPDIVAHTLGSNSIILGKCVRFFLIKPIYSFFAK